MAISKHLTKFGLHWIKKFKNLILGTIVIMGVANFVWFYYQDSTSCFREAILPFCFKDGSIENVDEGDWVQLSGLSRRDYLSRFEEDKFIRTSMGWAPILHRRDLRCGKNAIVPGYQLLAQCNPLSSHPCCNLNTGMCGYGPTNCDCKNCTNFKTMVSAELATWKPRECNLREFTWKDVCRMMNKNNIQLYFIGDSLIRHLHTTMLLLLTNNYEEGAIPGNVTEETRQQCSGVLQLTKKECSVEVMAQTVDELSENSVCPGLRLGGEITVTQIQDYHTTLIDKVRDQISTLMNRENAWIIGGVGLHYQLDFELLRNQYLDKVMKMLKQSHNGWPKMVWIENHAFSGFIRQKSGPHMTAIKTFNTIIGHYLKEHGVPVIKTFEASKMVRSFDGRHHGIGLNELKLKLILNYLHQFYKDNY